MEAWNKSRKSEVAPNITVIVLSLPPRAARLWSQSKVDTVRKEAENWTVTSVCARTSAPKTGGGGVNDLVFDIVC